MAGRVEAGCEANPMEHSYALAGARFPFVARRTAVGISTYIMLCTYFQCLAGLAIVTVTHNLWIKTMLTENPFFSAAFIAATPCSTVGQTSKAPTADPDRAWVPAGKPGGCRRRFASLFIRANIATKT